MRHKMLSQECRNLPALYRVGFPIESFAAMQFAFSTVACPKWDFETIAAR